ncbi:transposase [Roseomonas ludipueritiae]|uniref:Transposase n=1 Tax=Pseudoroseomonas ludipueritiae TaxID=198093 RepID=A0ABR7R9M2_9PROT|nr:transposase [Pseudoroseomonas ludipueritiae]
MGATDDMPSLPEDPAALRVLLLAALEQRDTALAERGALAARNEQLHHLLLTLKRLQRIAALYAIKAEIHGRPARDRLEVRQARSRPLVAELFTWLEI